MDKKIKETIDEIKRLLREGLESIYIGPKYRREDLFIVSPTEEEMNEVGKRLPPKIKNEDWNKSMKKAFKKNKKAMDELSGKHDG